MTYSGTMKRIAAFVGCLGAATAIAMSQACSSRICTAIGCPPGATLYADLATTSEQLRASDIAVCHNDECLSGSLAELTDATEGTGRGVTLPADQSTIDQTKSPRARAWFWLKGAGQLSITVEWTPWSPAELKAGDVYRVEIAGPGGEVTLRLDETVDRYVETYPNGEACGMQPCRSIVFDRRAP